MSKLSNTILNTIHKQKITPRSRWYFIAMHALLWMCFGITLVIGIVAVSLLFLEMSMPERPFMEWMPLPGPLQILPYLPFVWGFGSLLCVLMAYFVFHKTDRGYRIGTIWIVSILIVGSLIGGYLLHITKINERGEKNMRHMIPTYERMRNDFKNGMPLPEYGILPGKIQTMDANIYTIKCPDKNLWKVSLNCVTETCKKEQSALSLQKPVLFVGSIKGDTDDRVFEATDIQIPPHNKKGKMRNLFLPPLPPSTLSIQE